MKSVKERCAFLLPIWKRTINPKFGSWLILLKAQYNSLKKEIEKISKDLGFQLFGITKPNLSRESSFFSTWLQRGFAANMQYLYDRREERLNLEKYFPGARSILCFGMYYHLEENKTPLESPKKSLKIARYAKGKDYHLVMKKRLRKIANFIQKNIKGCELRICVDTSPLLERAFAYHAGLGWVGKNTCLINRHHGSYFFLGEIITNLDFPANHKVESDHCGSCRRCLDACPTDALSEPYTLDANRCISYWTIEHRGPLPEALHEQIGSHWFGCDICQEVCPWNHAPQPLIVDDAFKHPKNSKNDREIFEKFLKTKPKDFSENFKGSPLKRAHWQGLWRNAKIVLANLKREKDLPANNDFFKL